MQNLSILVRKVRSFTKIKGCDKRILLEALFFTAISRMVILTISFRRYSKYIGVYSKETPTEIGISDYKLIKKVRWAIDIVSRNTPWESKCLVQAMAAMRMLKRRNICSTLYLGVCRDVNYGMKAHAWLRCGQFYITGGYNRNEFKEVAKFANENLH
jgi:hypothetical protein